MKKNLIIFVIMLMERHSRNIISALAAFSLLFCGCSKSVDVTSVRLSESDLTLQVGETSKLVAIVEPPIADYDFVTWSSSDPSVATVEDGIIQVHKAGTARITASAGGVTSRVCNVTVNMAEVQEVITKETAETEESSVAEETAGDGEVAETEDSAEEETASDDKAETGSEAEESDQEEVTVVTADPEDSAEESAEEPEETEGVNGCHFIYNVDFGKTGSYIDLDSLVTVRDWRGRNFNDYPSYWDYYGPFIFTVDIANAECDMGCTRKQLPNSVTLVQTAPGETSANDPTSGATVSLTENRHGFLMCQFSTTVLAQEFNIYVKIRVKQGFGTIQTDWITIPVIREID